MRSLLKHARRSEPVSGDACCRVFPARFIGIAIFLLLGVMSLPCLAQDAEEVESPSESLLGSQRQITERYRRFEETLLRMAELNASTNPRRAALLRRVIAESRERLLDARFLELVELIEEGRYANALENQDSLQRDLMSILTLLLSEDRAKRLAEEKARLRTYLKQVQRIIREQKNLRRRTERAENPEQLAQKQDRLADDTGALKRDMKNASGGSPSGSESDGKSDGQPSEGKEGESGKGESGEGKSGEGKSGEGQSGQSSGQSSGKSGQESSGQENKGDQSDSESGNEESSNPGLHSTKSTQDRLEAGQAADAKSSRKAGRGQAQRSTRRARGSDPRVGAGPSRAGRDPASTSRGGNATGSDGS